MKSVSSQLGSTVDIYTYYSSTDTTVYTSFFDSSDNQQKNTYDYWWCQIHLNDVQNVPTSAETAIDISDVVKLRDFHTNVFVGTVDSIDGCSTTISTGEFVPMPQTYGKITILENLKGQIANNSITFAIGGGILSVADYEKDAPAKMIANHEKHRDTEIDKEATYYHFSLMMI